MQLNLAVFVKAREKQLKAFGCPKEKRTELF